MAEHAVPQAPQLVLLDESETQTPLQSVCPAGHAHDPFTHELPPPQVTPQPPQLKLSELVLTQAPLQSV